MSEPKKPNNEKELSEDIRLRDFFSGDLDRNEVKLDLEKFLRILDENSRLKDQLRNESNKDSNRKWLRRSYIVDEWRVFPRIFIMVYMYILVVASNWYMALPDPSGAQSAFISAVLGAGAAWFGLYAGTRNDGNRVRVNSSTTGSSYEQNTMD